jgi:hypothetical protein
VLGRWQSPYFGRSHDRDTRRRLRAMKRRFDPRGTLNPGVFFAPAFRVPGVQGTFRTTFPGVVRLLRGLYGWTLTAPFFRALIRAAAVERTPSKSWRNERLRQADHDAARSVRCSRPGRRRVSPRRRAPA